MSVDTYQMFLCTEDGGLVNPGLDCHLLKLGLLGLKEEGWIMGEKKRPLAGAVVMAGWPRSTNTVRILAFGLERFRWV